MAEGTITPTVSGTFYYIAMGRLYTLIYIDQIINIGTSGIHGREHTFAPWSFIYSTASMAML